MIDKFNRLREMSVDIDVKHSITDESQTVSKYGDNNNNKYNNNPLFRFVFLFFQLFLRSSQIVDEPDFVFSRIFLSVPA